MKEAFSQLVREFYAVRDKLVAEAIKRGLPDLRFTLDGKLVGDIGELYATEHYGLELLPPGTPIHDAVAPDGRRVQVKTTQTRGGISLDSKPEHLIVLLLKTDGTIDQLYNGAGDDPWTAANQPDGKGYRFVSHGKLVRLNRRVAANQRVPKQIARS